MAVRRRPWRSERRPVELNEDHHPGQRAQQNASPASRAQHESGDQDRGRERRWVFHCDRSRGEESNPEGTDLPEAGEIRRAERERGQLVAREHLSIREAQRSERAREHDFVGQPVAPHRDPEDDRRQDHPDPAQHEDARGFFQGTKEAHEREHRNREHGRAGRLRREEPALAARRLQPRIVADQRLVVDVTPAGQHTGIAEARAAADRPGVILHQRARRVDAHQLVRIVHLLEKDEQPSVGDHQQQQEPSFAGAQAHEVMLSPAGCVSCFSPFPPAWQPRRQSIYRRRRRNGNRVIRASDAARHSRSCRAIAH